MIDSAPVVAKIAARLKKPRSYRVLLRRCTVPEPARIQAIIEECFQELGIRPRGRVLIKPNVVTANRRYIHHSYTEPALVEQAIRVVQQAGATGVTIGESGGFGIPSRLFFSEAGFLDLRLTGARVMDFNVEPTVDVPLSRGLHHRRMRLAQSLAEADFLLWMPKLKYHICCSVTCSIKLNIGILTHRERMLYHDDRLDEKIVDLLEVGYPDAVIADAVRIGTGYESAPYPIDLGVIAIADDPVAMDSVACRLLSVDPRACRHLMLAMERGYGPPSLEDVRVEGDITVEELQRITAGHVSEYQDIHQVDTPIRFYNGLDPERGRFCHGGCLAAIKGALGTIDKRRPGSVKRARAGAIVTGVYEGDVDAGDGVALLVGSCTQVRGKITARKIRRVGGCPIGTKKLFSALPFCFRLPNPMFDLRDAWKFILFSIDKACRKLWARATGRFRRRSTA